MFVVIVAAGLAVGDAAVAESPRPKIGLVLSGGGAKGFAHIGVLKVLEEEGIPVDIITGTSMGSVVGALYATGYSASELAVLAKGLDWYTLIMDTVPRRNVLLRDRNDYDRFQISFDIKNRSLMMPRGLVKGQSLESELSILTIPYHSTSDYSTLPIPFRCIATDIVTGKAVVLDHGYLPDSVRASMSIPSFFTPVESGDLLLVDGGLVKNFPVSDARDMGADIIIGVDVGQPQYKKDELDSFSRIMEQSIGFLGDESSKKESKLCDILISPDIDGLTSSSFEDPGDIIARGERAAREHLPQIRALAAKLKQYPLAKPKQFLPHPQIVTISQVRVKGLSRVSENLVISLLAVDLPSTMTPSEIQTAVCNIYGSNMFETVLYRLVPDGHESYILELDVAEKDTHLFQLGVSYDTYMKGSILSNLTLRNLFWFGSMLRFDARFSENPGAKIATFYNTGGRSGIGIGSEIEGNSFEVNTYQAGAAGEKISGQYRLAMFDARVTAHVSIGNSAVTGIGIEKNEMMIFPEISSLITRTQTFETSDLFFFVKADTLDRYYYPRSGILFDGKVSYVSDRLSARSQDPFKPFMKYIASGTAAIPLSGNLSLHLDGSGGVIDGRDVPIPELFYLGGVYAYSSGFVPFPGLNFMEISGKRMFTAGISLQMEFIRNLFVIPRANVGKAEENTGHLFLRKGLCYGYGLTVGTTAFILPFELTLVRGEGSRGGRFLLYTNAGYRF